MQLSQLAKLPVFNSKGAKFTVSLVIPTVITTRFGHFL